MSDNQHTRRRVLAGTGTLAAGTIGSIALVSQNAAATADISGEFTVPDAKQVLTDKTLQDIRLVANVEWQFSANAPMTAVEVELHVGDSTDNLDLIARTEKTDLGIESLTGTEELSGSLMSAAAFDIDEFQPDGGEVSRSVVAELRLFVLREGSVEAEATAPTTFGVTVREEELQVTTTLGGDGEVTFTTD